MEGHILGGKGWEDGLGVSGRGKLGKDITFKMYMKNIFNKKKRIATEKSRIVSTLNKY